MFKNFCKTKFTVFIFILSSLVLLLFTSFFIQILVIIVAGVLGAVFITSKKQKIDEYKRPNLFALFLFVLPFLLTFFLVSSNELYTLFHSFYQVGSLVFGGGHVVLPLIAENVPVAENEFLVGYALSQAVPGPMFTIASYIGVASFENSPFLGALVATLAIFLPGFLLIIAFSKSFESYSKKPIIASAIIGINASVVALLFAALCNPIFISGVGSILDLIIAIAGFIMMRKYKFPIYYFIIGFCLYGIVGGFYV